MFYTIKYGIKNLVRWFHVIWNDRDVDYYYLLVLMKNKLLQMKNRMYGVYEGSEKDCDDIQDVIDALERIMNDDYCRDEFKNLHEKFFGTHELTIDMLINEDEYLTKEQEKEYGNQISFLSAKEDELKQKDIDFVCDTMKKRLKYWWC